MRKVSVVLLASVLDSTVCTPHTLRSVSVQYMQCKSPQLIKNHPCCDGSASKLQHPPQELWNGAFVIIPFHLSKVKVWLLCHLCAVFSLVLFCYSWTLAALLLLDAARPWGALCILYAILKLLGSSTQHLKVKTYCLPLSALKAVDAFKQVSEAVAEVRI